MHEDFALFPAVRDFYLKHPDFPRFNYAPPERLHTEGSFAAFDPSLPWLTKSLDDARIWFIEQEELHGRTTPEAALAFAEFLTAHSSYLESYIHHYHKPYLTAVRRLIEHYQNIFLGAHAIAKSGEKKMPRFIDAILPGFSGYRGEISSLIELPYVRNIGFHIDDLIGATKSSLIRETREFHQKIREALPLRLKTALSSKTFATDYPRLAYVIRNETSFEERYKVLIHWIVHEKEFDFLLKEEGRFVIVEVKNRTGVLKVSDLTHSHKKGRDRRSKTMLQQFDELAEIQALLAGGRFSVAKAPFGIAAYFPNSISPEAEALLQRHGIRVIQPLYL